MKARPFKFKQFTVHQDRCAMKVGTDGVLLGAWASVAHKPASILDIGAGTGLVGLMLAQRCNAELIDALEVEEVAFEQCVSNFEASPWADRLFCYHASLQDYVQEVEEQYDLIVSNPPFHIETPSSGDQARDQARQSQSLPFAELLKGVTKLLAPGGKFVVVIPHKQAPGFIALAEPMGLFPSKILQVRGNPGTEIKRSFLEFQFGENSCEYEELVIELARHVYTPEYINLTRDFYLKM
ncbi:MAG: methyltransferase [Eudoraea sp.]|nr:methyltransferase [Eudoraea sp.]NNJ41437.1 methyltransferase [Eudoraea sp.]